MLRWIVLLFGFMLLLFGFEVLYDPQSGERHYQPVRQPPEQ